MAATLVSVFAVIAFIGFLVLSALKFAKYSKLTTHSRFDLYPVPKEGKERAEHGGSYFEDVEWWRKVDERKLDRTTETLDIAKEMFAIKRLYVYQKSMWGPSFMFHWGIYVLLGWSVLLLLNVVWSPAWLEMLTNLVGVVGFLLAGVGVCTLLIRRVSDKSLSIYTTPAEYFNEALILVVLLTGAACWLGGNDVYTVARGVFTFSGEGINGLVALHLVLLGAMLLYIPASKMGHYAGKFFAFRSVAWDNDPNTKGSAVESNFLASAAKPATVQWASHMPQPKTETEE